MDDQKKIFSENLKRLLIKREKSQAEVADAMGVSRAAFNMWVKGVTIPRMPKIQQLAKYFHVEVSDLVDPPDIMNMFNEKTIKLQDMRNHDFVLDMEFLSRTMSHANMAKIKEFATFIKQKDEEEKKEEGDS